MPLRIEAKETDVTFTIIDGRLPNGLTMLSDGQITGIVTEEVSEDNEFNIVVEATKLGYEPTQRIFTLNLLDMEWRLSSSTTDHIIDNRHEFIFPTTGSIIHELNDFMTNGNNSKYFEITINSIGSSPMITFGSNGQTNLLRISPVYDDGLVTGDGISNTVVPGHNGTQIQVKDTLCFLIYQNNLYVTVNGDWTHFLDIVSAIATLSISGNERFDISGYGITFRSRPDELLFFDSGLLPFGLSTITSLNGDTLS